MNPIERLIAAGIDRESAGEAVTWFLTQSNEEHLNCYIANCETKNYERMAGTGA